MVSVTERELTANLRKGRFRASASCGLGDYMMMRHKKSFHMERCVMHTGQTLTEGARAVAQEKSLFRFGAGFSGNQEGSTWAYFDGLAQISEGYISYFRTPRFGM